MIIGTREVIHQIRPYLGGSGTVPTVGAVDKLGETTDFPVQTRRREARVAEQIACSYELCESISEEGVVIQQGEAYSLNRSPHGILLFMGYSPRLHQLLELHVPESRWRRSLNLFEVQWTKSVHVDSCGDLFLVGCQLVFGLFRYWAF